MLGPVQVSKSMKRTESNTSWTYKKIGSLH